MTDGRAVGVTAAQLADLSGTTEARIHALTDAGVLQPDSGTSVGDVAPRDATPRDAAPRYVPGDAHRVRLIDALHVADAAAVGGASTTLAASAPRRRRRPLGFA